MTDRSAIRNLDADESALAQEIRTKLDIDVARCLECGKCSGGCSYVHGFDFSPRQMIQLIKLGERKKLLAMDALWLCQSCQVCLDRCPSSIDTPRILDYLRMQAHIKYTNKTKIHIEKFYEIMLNDVKNYGRIDEFIMVKYNFITRQYFNNAYLGKKFFLKGKFKLFSQYSKDIQSLQPFFADVVAKDEK